VNQIQSYKRLKLSVLWIISNKILPRKCRSKKTNELLDLAEKGIERVKLGLDVRNII
jgi:hypothetical protein